MPAARKKNWFGEKKVTYHRDVKAERAQKVKEQKAHDKAMAAHQVDIQEGYAYDQGKHDKSKGRKARPTEDNILLSQAEKLLGKQKAYAIAKRGYMQGYRQNPAKKGRKGNPEDKAAALSEAWHGRAPKHATDIIEQVHYHGVLTELGQLQEIKVLVTTRKAQAIFFDEDTMLASSENGKQLYVVGGDQSLDLAALGITGEESEKDCVVIGEVYSLTYVTDKQHLGKADKVAGPYEHILGEETNKPPILIYDRLNNSVGFAGGAYRIDATDYDGRHSAGIRD